MFEVANGVVYGTWLPGSASSSHTVPLNTLSTEPPLFESSVTIVPAGDFNVICMSPTKVCVMNVLTLTSEMYGPAPAIVSVDVTVEIVVGIVFGTSVLL